MRFEFLNYDDDIYVSMNAFVQRGVTVESVRWAFTTAHAANWHPLTWISHMLDWDLYGAWAGGHHATSVLLHAANAMLLLLVLERMTGTFGPSVFVAALFALHPLQVESVAWVAERKNVLSTLFWILTMLAYLRYTTSPTVVRYLLVVAALAAGLMSKAMLVTVPLVLLLLDFWPLGRLDGRRRLWEKLPLVALSAAASVVTYLAQQSAGQVMSTAQYPLSTRLANALVTYATYAFQMLWPRDLSIYYPHVAAALPAWKVAASALALALVTAVAAREWRHRPYLLVGWLWYTVTLLPVIGLIQVGIQARADRYAYVPLIGLFVVVAWGGRDLVRSWSAAAGGVVVLLLALSTGLQVRHWRNSTTVFEHALAAAGENDIAHLHLALALEESGQPEDAIGHYREAARLGPDGPSHYHLANALVRQGDVNGALAAFREAVRAEPQFVLARYNFGELLLAQGQKDEAIEQFAAAVQIDPTFAEAQFHWGMALASLSRTSEAATHFKEAIRINSAFAEAHYNLAVAHFLMGDYDSAWKEVARARQLGFPPAEPFLVLLAEKMPEPQ